jgi:hypothetical protein
MRYNLLNKIDELKWKSTFFIILSILIKILFFFFVYFLDNPNNSNLYIDYGGDTSEYMGACENLYSKGEYIINTLYGFSDKTFRMPGLAFIYLPLRFIFSKENTMNGIIVFQILCSGLGTYYLSMLAKNIFKTKILFYLVFIFSNISFSLVLYNNILLTESLANSFMIFSFFFFEKGLREKRFIFFLFSGFFMTWMIFLRPYTIILYILALLYLVYFFYKKRISVKIVLAFLISFFIIEGSWIIRNYIKVGEFIPLQTSSKFLLSKPTCEQSKFKLVTTFGFNYEWWIKNTESAWFNNPKQVLNIPTPSNEIMPKIIFNGGLTIDSLILARDYMHLVQNADTSYNSKNGYYNYHSERIFKKFIIEYKKYQVFDYLIGSRIRLIKSFLSENYYWPLAKISYPTNMIYIAIDFFANYLIKIIGFFGLVLIVFKYKQEYLKLYLVTFVPFFIMILFPIYFGCDEKRFFVLSIPFLVICLSYVFSRVIELKKYKYLSIFLILIVPFIFALKSTLHLIHF